MGRPPRPSRTFGSLTDACTWLLPQLRSSDSRWDEAMLLDAHEQLRQECGVQP